jgi:hypothetical protein
VRVTIGIDIRRGRGRAGVTKLEREEKNVRITSEPEGAIVRSDGSVWMVITRMRFFRERLERRNG